MNEARSLRWFASIAWAVSTVTDCPTRSAAWTERLAVTITSPTGVASAAASRARAGEVSARAWPAVRISAVVAAVARSVFLIGSNPNCSTTRRPHETAIEQGRVRSRPRGNAAQ